MLGDETYALSLAAILEPWLAVTLSVSSASYRAKGSYIDMIYRGLSRYQVVQKWRVHRGEMTLRFYCRWRCI